MIKIPRRKRKNKNLRPIFKGKDSASMMERFSKYMAEKKGRILTTTEELREAARTQDYSIFKYEQLEKYGA